MQITKLMAAKTPSDQLTALIFSIVAVRHGPDKTFSGGISSPTPATPAPPAPKSSYTGSSNNSAQKKHGSRPPLS
jgi:hypothetical protein